MTTRAGRILWSAGILIALSCAPGSAVGQAGDLMPSGEPPPEEAVVRGPVSPGGAFLRSLVVPGWGHLASESPTRGAFYIAAQSGTIWMILKSLAKRGDAVDARDVARDVVESELRLEGVQSADSLRFLSDQDPRVERWEELRAARGQQVEDWVSLGLFLTLLGAADAFVAAHLADYPDPLTLDVLPGRRGAALELQLSYPMSGRSRR